MDLGDYLDQWMVRQRLRLQPRTWDAYRQTIDVYLAPSLSDVPLAHVQPALLEQLYGNLLDHGGRRGRPLALATIRDIHGVLRKALADAVRIDLLSANPLDRVALPRHDLRRTAPASVEHGPQRRHGVSCAAPTTTSTPSCGRQRSGPGCGAANCSGCGGATWTSTRAWSR